MPRRPRRRKTIEDLTTLTGTEFYQDEDGLTFYIEDLAVDQQIYMGELLAKFYRINDGQNPLAFQLIEDNSQAIKEKLWYAVMRGNFFINIEKNQATEGPHSCKLWFRSFTPPRKTYWLASCQLMVFYFNEQEMKTALQVAIDTRDFFMLPENRDVAIIP